jgi:hypothetical protein
MSVKVLFLTTAAILLAGLLFLVSLHPPLSVLADKQPQRASNQPDASLLGTAESWVTAYEAPFAFVNQPWDWVEGRTTAGAMVQAALIRGSSTYATAQTVADSDGWFALQFLQSSNHVDILEGDTVTVSGGVLNESIDVITIEGTIDVAADTVSGQMSDGVFPSTGMAGVGRPSETVFTTRTIAIAANGTYLADFSGEVDIQNGYVAKVWYTNPDGNQVRKILHSNGLDVRVRMTQDLVEGVTVPETVVQITVRDSSDVVKGTDSATADRTGHYKTQVPSTSPVDIVNGDKVTAAALGATEDIDVDVRHVSRINPATDAVSGQLFGGDFPASGRVDLWHAETDRWYYQDVEIDAGGNYLADFSGVVDVERADRIHVWYIDPNGNQVASVSSGLEIGASTTTDLIWGYTTPGANIDITVRDSPGGNIIGTATVLANESGFFETAVSNPSPLEIVPGQEVNVTANSLQSSLSIGHFQILPDFINQTLSINGPPDAVFHVELHRSGESAWMEAIADNTGHALVEVDSGYDLRGGDRLDLISYEVVQGHTIHQTFRVEPPLFLPIILKDAS